MIIVSLPRHYIKLHITHKLLASAHARYNLHFNTCSQCNSLSQGSFKYKKKKRKNCNGESIEQYGVC